MFLCFSCFTGHTVLLGMLSASTYPVSLLQIGHLKISALRSRPDLTSSRGPALRLNPGHPLCRHLPSALPCKFRPIHTLVLVSQVSQAISARNALQCQAPLSSLSPEQALTSTMPCYAATLSAPCCTLRVLVSCFSNAIIAIMLS